MGGSLPEEDELELDEPPFDDDVPEAEPVVPSVLLLAAVLPCSGAGAPIVKLHAGITTRTALIKVKPHNFRNRHPPLRTQHDHVFRVP